MFKYHRGSLDRLLSSHVLWAAGIVCCNPMQLKGSACKNRRGTLDRLPGTSVGGDMGVGIALGALDAFLWPLTSDPGVQRGMQYSPHFMDEGIQPQRG